MAGLTEDVRARNCDRLATGFIGRLLSFVSVTYITATAAPELHTHVREVNMNPLGHPPLSPSFHVGRILFATDFSDASNRALPIAATMARTFDAELTVAHVWAEPVCTVPEAVYGCSSQIEHSVRQCLLDVTERPEFVGIETRTAFKAGRVVESLIALADELRMDMIVCGTHGRTGVSHAVMGSVAEALVRRSPCPVLTVGPHFQTQPVVIKASAETVDLDDIDIACAEAMAMCP